MTNARVVHDMQAVRELGDALRRAGRRVVFTNGCFDLLHVGHARCLNEARALGDALVVGLNSDASVRRIKDPSLPVIPENERAEMLLALKAVDHVVIFDSPTVDGLLDALRPQVYAKGRDYIVDTLPESATVKRLNIQFAAVGDEKAHASSDLIRRIAEIASSRRGAS